MSSFWNLQTLWFLLIAVLWMGYFFLEGFDFGVGILLPFLGRDDLDRRVLLNTIGPHWDGNEVWLLVAGGAMFAAFPEWYATVFSGFYLALFLILVALIFRAVAFEFRGKVADPRWQKTWDWAIFFGSLLPAILWGVAFADFLHGVPLNAQHEFTGNFFDLVGPYALIGGVMSLTLFTLHGALFLVLKTDGDLQLRARFAASRLFWAALVGLGGFLTWSYANALASHDRGIVPDVVPLAALAALIAVGWFRRERWDLTAFFLNGSAILLTTATIFLNLYPRVLISTVDRTVNSLTISNASSSQYTLTVISIIAAFFVPVVLGYQGWTYWIFRKRILREPQPVSAS